MSPSPPPPAPRSPSHLHLLVVADGLDGWAALEGGAGAAGLQLDDGLGAAGQPRQLPPVLRQLVLLLLWAQWGEGVLPPRCAPLGRGSPMVGQGSGEQAAV